MARLPRADQQTCSTFNSSRTRWQRTIFVGTKLLGLSHFERADMSFELAISSIKGIYYEYILSTLHACNNLVCPAKYTVHSGDSNLPFHFFLDDLYQQHVMYLASLFSQVKRTVKFKWIKNHDKMTFIIIRISPTKYIIKYWGEPSKYKI